MVKETKPYIDSGQLQVITINHDREDALPEVRREIRKNRIKFPVIYDGTVYDPEGYRRSIPGLEWGVSGIPQSFLINPDGVIVASQLREEKLAVALDFFIGNDRPILGLRGSSVLNDDGSISVYANVMNQGREDIEVRLKSYFWRCLLDENNLWQDIVDLEPSPQLSSATVSFEDFSETTYEFLIPAWDEVWDDSTIYVKITVPGTEHLHVGEKEGLEFYYALDPITLVNVELVDDERVITRKTEEELSEYKTGRR